MIVKKNIVLSIEYDGTHFKGWQAQKVPPVRSVESVLVSAIEKVANHTIDLMCAGRTDAGVHARRQIVNFITESDRSEYSWIRGINTHLPVDCAVNAVYEAPLDFHARYSAKSRFYQYVICQNRYRSVMDRLYTTHISYPLDAQLMQLAARDLIGEHDFNAFRSSECQAPTSIREIFAIDVSQKDHYIYINVHGNAFLHHMVRNIVGVLLKVGSGKAPVSYAQQVLLSLDRKQGGITAPAQGLFLDHIEYADGIFSEISAINKDVSISMG